MAEDDSRPKGSVSVQKVLEATGTPYARWVRVLDAFDVKTHGHTAAAKHLLEDHQIPPWYSQAITVRYELERGLRSGGQTDEKGLHVIQLSKTLPASVSTVYRSLATTAGLAAWLSAEARIEAEKGGDFHDGRGHAATLRVVTPERRLRLHWTDHGALADSMLALELEDAGKDRTRLRWIATKVSDRAAGERERAHWKDAFERLATHLAS